MFNDSDFVYFIRYNDMFGFSNCSFSQFMHYLSVFNPRKVHCKKNKKGICIYQSWYIGNYLVAFSVFCGF